VVDNLERLAVVSIIMRVFVVHCDQATAASTGLFGLLGDAPVQVVDAADEVKVNTFVALTIACERKVEGTIGQDVHRKPLELMRKQVRDIALQDYRSEKMAKAMRPAYMFRHCSQFCNCRAQATACRFHNLIALECRRLEFLLSKLQSMYLIADEFLGEMLIA
jgi:hypothetical protein